MTPAEGSALACNHEDDDLLGAGGQQLSLPSALFSGHWERLEGGGQSREGRLRA